MEKLLVEIGSEEIPAGYIGPALSAMAEALLKKLRDARIDCGNAETYGTPRRLAVLVSDVAPKQKSVTEKIMGPPEKVGFDATGKPTVAAEKFAEKVGVPLAKVFVEKTEKGPYLFAKRAERGVSTKTVLKQILPDVISAVPFPKSMKWADMRLYFARPIHSMVALYGNSLISFSMEKIKSGRFTNGHSFMSPAKIRIDHPDEYVGALENAGVVPDIDKRRAAVKAEVERAAATTGGHVLDDPELLDIVTNLVEHPYAVVGRFEDKFLEVPDEILITAMREHQKYFAIADDSGRLMPCFIAVNNTLAKDMDLVATGHGRVIRARLEDARFFYRADVAENFDNWNKKLSGVLFQAKLGSMQEKVGRIEKLAAWVAETAKSDKATATDAVRAASLCKADLVSQVVVEFPKLQGIMGRIYAAEKKETPRAAAAIEEHYRPVYSGGALPESPAGAIVSIADKMDSICGCFGVGLLPTGASDPYALRRQGIGVIQILLKFDLALSLADLIRTALANLSDKLTEPADRTAENVLTFLSNRMSHLLAEQGYAKDVIAAVLASGCNDVPDVWRRVAALDKLKDRPDFEPLASAFKRVVNIIRKADVDPGAENLKVDAKLFSHDSESALHQAVSDVRASVQKDVADGAYDQALARIATLRDPVDAFFDGVLVMDKDDAVRANRLALLGVIAGLFDAFADFSKISAG